VHLRAHVDLTTVRVHSYTAIVWVDVRSLVQGTEGIHPPMKLYLSARGHFLVPGRVSTRCILKIVDIRNYREWDTVRRRWRPSPEAWATYRRGRIEEPLNPAEMPQMQRAGNEVSLILGPCPLILGP